MRPLTDNRAADLAEIVKSAIEFAPEARRSFLDANCPPKLRTEVESLLEHEDFVSGFIETPAVHRVAGSFTAQGVFAAGDAVANYEIVSPIGKGGMGEVYRARDWKLQREV